MELSVICLCLPEQLVLEEPFSFHYNIYFTFRKEQSVFIMIDNDADILAKKELIEKRMNERKNKRVTENK